RRKRERIACVASRVGTITSTRRLGRRGGYMKTTILLADDHAIMREGLAALILSRTEFKIVGEASTGREAMELAAKLCPDIVVMDIGMPDLNGIESTRRIMHADPKTRVVALSTFSDR